MLVCHGAGHPVKRRRRLSDEEQSSYCSAPNNPQFLIKVFSSLLLALFNVSVVFVLQT